MANLISESYTFNYPFQIVAFAYAQKYPHPLLSHVKTVDTLDRQIDEQGVMRSRRLLMYDQKPFCSVFAIEESIVDPVSKKIEIKTRNLNFSSVFTGYEECTYQGLENGQTKYQWGGYTKVAGIFDIASLIKSTCIKNFNRGKAVLEDIIQNKLNFYNEKDLELKWTKLKNQEEKLHWIRSMRPAFIKPPRKEYVMDVLKTLESESQDQSYKFLKKITKLNKFDSRIKMKLNLSEKVYIKKLIDRIQAKKKITKEKYEYLLRSYGLELFCSK